MIPKGCIWLLGFALPSVLPSSLSPAGNLTAPGDRGRRRRGHLTSEESGLARGRWQAGCSGLPQGRLGRAGEALRATPSAHSGFPQPQPPPSDIGAVSAGRCRPGHSPRPAARSPRRPAGAVPRRSVPPARERLAGTQGAAHFPRGCQTPCPAAPPGKTLPRRSGRRTPRKQRRVLGAQLSCTTQ